MANHDHSNVPITVIGAIKERKVYSSDISQIFREGILNSHDAPVSNVVIEPEGDQFLAHIAHGHMYSFETVKFDVANDAVSNVVHNYEMTKSTSPGSYGNADEDFSGYDFFVATPNPEIPTALKMVQDVFNSAKNAGLNPLMLTGPAANVQNYQLALQAGLKGFCSVGHGSPSSILLSDGILSSTWIDTLKSTALHPEVITWNSCKVFNNPLLDSIYHHGARTYIGGVSNLRIGPSEKVTSGFWAQVLVGAPMGDTLRDLNAEHADAGQFGISGDQGKF